jgi:arabinose-5-phosphate isomerase
LPAAPTAEARTIERGRRVLRLEREAIAEAERRLGPAFAAAVSLIARSTGRVIVAGVGKSGLIGRKIAATLTSTGTPATSLHPVDSVHGDLGLVGPDDVAILLSKSGTTEELLALLQHLQRLGVRSIAITSDVESPLARHADVALDAWVSEEACPHDLAPTTSTTVALALGDALAIALLEEKGFRAEDFARLHPGGALGRRLLTRVGDVMLRDDLPVLGPEATMREAVVQLAERRGIVVVCDDDRRMLGIVTSGDFTRLLEREDAWLSIPLHRVMRRDPRTARE